MKQLPSFRTILLLAVASLTMVAVVPWRQQAAATDNLDDSLVLLAASKVRQADLQSRIKSPNELRVLAAAYRQQADNYRSSSPSLYQSFYVKANQYDEQAKALERRRARGGPLHQFGNLLGRVVGRTMDFVGHAAEIYVEGEIDNAIDKVANAPARALQRRLNPLWKILGSKLGGGLTGFLRVPIDRAIQRNVDRILYGRPHRPPARATVPAAQPSAVNPVPLLATQVVASDAATCDRLSFIKVSVGEVRVMTFGDYCAQDCSQSITFKNTHPTDTIKLLFFLTAAISPDQPGWSGQRWFQDVVLQPGESVTKNQHNRTPHADGCPWSFADYSLVGAIPTGLECRWVEDDPAASLLPLQEVENQCR